MSRSPKEQPVPMTRVEERGGRPAEIQIQRFAVRVLKGRDRGKRVVLEGDRIRIGRGAPNDLPLDDELASRLHAELSVTADGFRLLDLGSTNGTYLGDNRVGDVYVAAGDRVRIGDSVMALEAVDGAVSLPLAAGTRFGGLLGQSVAMRRAVELLQRAAPTEATLLLQGETGTGKEEAARAIHTASPRASGPFVVLDCGSIPATLLAAELFGFERGAFTGAVETRKGAFERAGGGTLLLDEIGELALDLQPQLLRVLERREVQKLGGSAVISADVRVIAATNRDLRRDINAGRFRADLYFRLAVVEVTMPPLRDRPDDLPLLVSSICEDLRRKTGVRIDLPTASDLDRLARHHWPGNVRELRNVVERSMLLGAGLDVIETVATPATDGPPVASLPYREAKAAVVERFERAYVEDILRRASGNVSKAARDAKMDRSHLMELIRKHGLSG